MTFLPPYIPSEEEKLDSKLYAANVREVMAEALGVPTTDHSFSDKKAYIAHLKAEGKWR